MRFIHLLLISAGVLVGCNRGQDDDLSGNFNNAGADAQKAIAENVNFTLTEDIFHRWERAQANLDRLPDNVLASAPNPNIPDPVQRAVVRLQGSPPARRAIESAGISVHDFVLATVALAQAVRASHSGVAPTVGALASNVKFLESHSSRYIDRAATCVWVPPSEMSDEERAVARAQRDSGGDSAIATGEERAQPTVPALEDWSRPGASRRRDTAAITRGTNPAVPPRDSISRSRRRDTVTSTPTDSLLLLPEARR